MRVPILIFYTSYDGGPENKGEGLPEGLRGKEGWSSGLLERYKLGRRELGTWIVVCVRKPLRA
jgi:hypothetical protein